MVVESGNQSIPLRLPKRCSYCMGDNSVPQDNGCKKPDVLIKSFAIDTTILKNWHSADGIQQELCIEGGPHQA